MSARLGVSVAVIAALVAFVGATARAGATAPPRVLLIGDSVATGMQWHDDAISILQRNVDLDWQVAVCRRLTGISCPFQGNTSPTLVDLVDSLGTVPPIVVVEMGYNDSESTFSASVHESIQTLLQHGAQHILWLTLREVRRPYVRMNAVLQAGAKAYPELKLVDWNGDSRNQPAWFQSDGMHLLDSGGVAMATLIHLAIDEVALPLQITSTVGTGRVDVPFTAQLSATGGEPPYRWQFVGTPPTGLHLLADGRLYGIPRRVQRVALTVRVGDAEGQVASRRLVLAVDP